MLKIFHNKKIAKLIWLGLLAIITPAFLFWGIGTYRNSEKEEGDFGRLFGKRISRQEYVGALKASQLQLRMQFGEAYDQIQKFIDLRSLTLQRLALLKEARRRHLAVSDREVVAYVSRDPSFMRRGVFDKTAYETAVKYGLRMTPRAYEEQVRQNILIRKLSEQIAGNTAADDNEVRETYRKEHEQIDLEYAAALPADFAPGINVTDEEAKTYFSGHAVEFKQPLSFNLEYISTDKEHQVTAVNARLEKEPLEKIAADMGLELKETGFFTQNDPIPGIGWSQELAGLLGNAPQGKIFAPLEMEKKYYILRLKERKEPYVPEFEAVKDKVKTAIKTERARQAAREKMDSLHAKLAEEAAKAQAVNMAGLAAGSGLKAGTTGMFKFGSYLEGIGASDPFHTAGSALKENQFSEVLELPTGFYIVKLKAREPLDEQKFSQEKESVRGKLIQQKKQEAFGKFVEELMQKALQ